MHKYRENLPQLAGSLFLTDGGMETTLIFHNGIELPEFASFDLLKNEHGRNIIKQYFKPYIDIAKQYQVGFILESVTWRANKDWAKKLGYDKASVKEVNIKAIQLLENIQAEYDSSETEMVISGCIGPGDDGYNPQSFMSVEQAQAYHHDQIETFSETSCDMVTALTMTYCEEAIGITLAAKALCMPVVISFTLETNGCLPTGESLKAAIEKVDQASQEYPAYYMINCAHPSHFENIFEFNEPWIKRVRGLRANASCLSHAELDEAQELDAGNPDELGAQYKVLRNKLANLNVLGGCCGTDHRHIEAIIKATY
ncbi:homocysteine S-methyltransferase family protein [Thalassotalea psychrophila]|uniref:Homocysteine S-methyltransferase family protein n=1 Tax=Thalassotalea psychrophila TaxID=3065647 RepID=A0ABY9TPD3_9GAMM|nr:homocysteine S-methyltransferase family protein [Colwelliaceae bacterium SQ149]